jgi:hypothetical protein
MLAPTNIGTKSHFKKDISLKTMEKNNLENCMEGCLMANAVLWGWKGLSNLLHLVG